MDRAFSYTPPAINDSCETPGHDIEDTGNACEQENGRKSKLNGVTHIIEIDGCAE